MIGERIERRMTLNLNNLIKTETMEKNQPRRKNKIEHISAIGRNKMRKKKERAVSAQRTSNKIHEVSD